MNSLYYYIDVSLELENNCSIQVTEHYFKLSVIRAVQKLFGEVTASLPIDLIKFNSKNNRAILRVPRDSYVKIRSSLTLCGEYQNTFCIYNIHKASPLLLALQGDSRNYQH